VYAKVAAAAGRSGVELTAMALEVMFATSDYSVTEDFGFTAAIRESPRVEFLGPCSSTNK
jgi:hypothetical protein